MDIDTVTKKNSHEDILNTFKNDNIDILTIDKNWSGIKRAEIYKHKRSFIVGVLRAKGDKK